MSQFSGPLASLNANVLAVFGDTVTWVPQNPSVAPYTLTGVMEFADEPRAAGYFAVLKCVLLSSLATALNGSTDLAGLDADQVQFNGVTYRVQNVSDPDYSGAVSVFLRKPGQ